MKNNIYIRVLILIFSLSGVFLCFMLTPPDTSASFIRDYLFYEFFRESSMNAKHLSNSLAEITALLSASPVLTEEWFEGLVKEKIITSAYLRSSTGEVRHGKHFIHDDKAKRGYRIADDGLLHYILVLQKPTVFLEVIIDNEHLKRGLEIPGGKNSLHFLFDARSGKYIVISGNELLFPANIMSLSMENTFIMRGLNLLIRMKVPLTDLEIFSVYRFPVGMSSLHLFGLITLLVFAIIVIVWAVEGSNVIKETGGGISMGTVEEDKKIDVISEIDREISDIVEEMGSSEQEEKPAEKDKKPEERWSDLEKDGIIIKK
ncbi:MAG: hypothetical protein ACUVWJ_05330 [Spirochaetota bacterium]